MTLHPTGQVHLHHLDRATKTAIVSVVLTHKARPKGCTNLIGMISRVPYSMLKLCRIR